jgi:hypothetical protein
MRNERLPGRERVRRQRQELPAAACDLFSERGCHSVSMHEVVVQKPAELGLVHPEYPGGMLQRVFSSAYHRRDDVPQTGLLQARAQVEMSEYPVSRNLETHCLSSAMEIFPPIYGGGIPQANPSSEKQCNHGLLPEAIPRIPLPPTGFGPLCSLEQLFRFTNSQIGGWV